MEDFPKYYKILFNAMTDAIKELDAHNYGTAAAHLKRGQAESEIAFLMDTDGADAAEPQNPAACDLPPIDKGF